MTLPGTVQFENYDNGGADIAYYDTRAANLGGAYRTNAVDIKGCTDSGGGYLIGYTAAGEWLTYTVNVRLASRGAGGTFHIEVNGVGVFSDGPSRPRHRSSAVRSNGPTIGVAETDAPAAHVVAAVRALRRPSPFAPLHLRNRRDHGGGHQFQELAPGAHGGGSYASRRGR